MNKCFMCGVGFDVSKYYKAWQGDFYPVCSQACASANGKDARSVPEPEEWTGMDQVEKIIAYEEGEMSEEEMIDFFQELIDSGLARELQRHYGRMAERLIDSGVCVQK